MGTKEFMKRAIAIDAESLKHSASELMGDNADFVHVAAVGKQRALHGCCESSPLL
jgi:hypothetical protein